MGALISRCALFNGMREKDISDIVIEGYGMEGEGVAHAGDAVLFVPYTAVGDRVRVVVDRVKGKVAFAHIIKMLSPSAERRDPACPAFGKCGGCAMRHLPYVTQLEIKKKNVISLFGKNAGIELADIPVCCGEAEDGYRNKVALPFGVEEGRPVLGMYRRGTHKVLPLERCPLHGEWVTPLFAAVTDFAREKKLSVYDERRGKGLLRHIVARRLPHRGGYRYGVVLVANGDSIPHEKEFAAAVSAAFEGKANVYFCRNTMRNNVILTPEIRTLLGEDALVTELAGGEWEISPLSFLQVNFPVAEKIYADVVDRISAGETVVDAYSGTGIMSALIGRKAGRVVGIEVIRAATENAARNAERFGVGDRVTHLCGEVEELLPSVVREIGDYTLVVDPPRAGLDESVTETILRCPPKRILYVSCSPATLTRDVARLSAAYRVDEVKLYDMFPNTPHCEVVVSMSRAVPKL